MQQLFNSEMSAADRVMILEQHADKVEDSEYYKALTAEQITERKELFFDNAHRLNKLQTELKLISQRVKDQIKPIQTDQTTLLQEIRTGQIEVKGKLYHIANFDTSMMETYNADGELIASRRLRPDEKQTNVFAIKSQTN